MITYNDEDIEEIIFEMKNNKAVILPTDTQIGLAAIDKSQIYKIKKRSYNKKVILFVRGIEEVDNPSDEFKKLAKKFWPGKLTIVENGVSYRMPNSPICLKLLDKLRKFYCSSANVSGSEPINDVQNASTMFSKNLDNIILVESKLGDGVASTVYDIDKHKILRLGNISEEQINECLQKKINYR